ncbi:MAG: type II toxin-antitoxin system HicB family antitoxin [Anaerolineae bacterium]
MRQPLDYYLSLPYTIELVPEEDGTWFVRVRELPGCMSVGDTPDDAVAMIRDAMAGWLAVAIEDGDDIPEPRALSSYSGKFVIRVPASLHRDLVEAAEREGVSLNQYCNVALARHVGRPAPIARQVAHEAG